DPQRQWIACIAPDEGLPLDIRANELFVLQHLPSSFQLQASKVQGPHRRVFPLQLSHFFRLFPAGHQQATPMPSLSHPLQQSTISSISLAKLTGALSRLQDRLEVVQHQQAMVIPQSGDKQRYLLVYLPWQICMLLVRDKADALLQEDFRRR